jgi:hypothetical protein
MRFVGGERPESWPLYAIAGTLLIAGPLWRELFVSRYPIHPEWFALLLVAAGVGAVLALGSWRVGGLAGTILFAGLLFVFVDLQFDLYAQVWTAILLAGGCLLLAFVLSRHRAAIASLALAAFYLASLIRPAESTVALATAADHPSPGRPLLVHVILDELLGVGGFYAAGDTATARFLTDFYLTRGFELYEAAYSRYRATRESVPGALSLGQTLHYDTDLTEHSHGYRVRILRNPYFAKLQTLGYGLRVHQSTYLDLCADSSAPVLACNEHADNSIANIGHLDGRWTARALSAAGYFLNTRSEAYPRLIHAPSIGGRAAVGGGVAGLRGLRSDLEEHHAAGTAYFVHVLVPHRPVQVDSTCRTLENQSDMFAYNLPPRIDDSRWREVRRLYAGQVRCGHRLLDQVLDAIDRTAGRRNSIVIVHGDHGSRMYQRAASGISPDKYTAEQLSAAHSTVLAIRRPDVLPVVHTEPVPLQDFIWKLARSDFMGTPSPPWRHEIRWTDSTRRDSVVVPLTPANMLWARRRD